MSEDQFSDELDEFQEIDISDLLQVVLTMQAELGVVSDLLAEVLKTGQLNRTEMIRSMHTIGDLSLEAMEILSDNEEEIGQVFEQNPNNNNSSDIN